MFLNFLLHSMDSIDGIRGSRKEYHDEVYWKVHANLPCSKKNDL